MKTVWMDFDGVLAEYTKWISHNHIGKPIHEMIELVKILHKNGVKIALVSTRFNPHPFLDNIEKEDEVVTSGESLLIVGRWLKEQGIHDCFCYVGPNKPMADYGIDDKVLRYGLEKDYKGTLTGSELYQILLEKHKVLEGEHG